MLIVWCLLGLFERNQLSFKIGCFVFLADFTFFVGRTVVSLDPQSAPVFK